MPTEQELEQSRLLIEYLKSINVYQTANEDEHRENVLKILSELCQSWVKSYLEKNSISTEKGEKDSYAVLYPFGSYRLQVYAPDADIDVYLLSLTRLLADSLMVGPKRVSRDDIFTQFIPILKSNPNITRLLSIKDAYVPLIKMKFYGVNIDLLYVSMPRYDTFIPSDFDILDNENLRGLDDAGINSINGRRVSDALLQIVPNYESFRAALLALKAWSKNRGIYANVFGYLGGVNWTILLARVSQMYPNACPSTLLHHFFKVYARWQWPCPVCLTKITSSNIPELDKKVWNPQSNANDRQHIMPIITPTYPSKNSSYNVTQSTFFFIEQEIKLADNILPQILKNQLDWKVLFEPLNFFELYKYYVMITISADTEDKQDRWFEWVKCKLRGLIRYIESTPYVTPHFYPTAYTVPKSVNNIGGQCYFIGLYISIPEENELVLDLSHAITQFYQSLRKNQEDGMFIEVKYVKYSNKVCEIPDYVYKPKNMSMPRRKSSIIKA